MICIFCGSDNKNNSIPHIIPESLGGKKSPIGKDGVTCDNCNQYFGQKVESKALNSFPFICYRVLASVASKKNKMPSMKSNSGGRIQAAGIPGFISVEADDEKTIQMINGGSKTQLRIVAEVTEPLPVCRMLLKIGLEQLSKEFYDVAISNRVLEARKFARNPGRGNSWWFILKNNPEELLSKAIPEHESSIEIIEMQGVLTSVLTMPGISTLTPLEAGAYPPERGEMLAPEYRVIWATC